MGENTKKSTLQIRIQEACHFSDTELRKDICRLKEKILSKKSALKRPVRWRLMKRCKRQW